MARGGKREGSGRKPTGKVAMLVRVQPEVRARLERAAKRAGRTLSHEAELALADVLIKPQADPATRALCYLITRIPMIAKTAELAASAPEFNWRNNRFDFEVFRYALVKVLDALAPALPVEKSRYLYDDNPEAMGGGIATMIVGALKVDPNLFYAIGDARGADRKSAAYAMPQAARDLKTG